MTINPHEIHLWIFNDEEIRDETFIQEYTCLLSDFEKTKKMSFHFPQHQHRYLITRAMIRKILSTYSPHISPTEWCFSENPYGKPKINYPVLTSPIYFNISHTEKMIVIAISTEEEIGVDVEYRDRNNEFMSIAERYFSVEEVTALKKLSGGTQKNYFLMLWTLKEAYLKAKGKGFFTPANQCSFSIDEKNNVTFSCTHEIEPHPEYFYFELLSPSPEHQIAVAVNTQKPGNRFTVHCKTIPLDSY